MVIHLYPFRTEKLSIPNREVKPISADGTAKPSGRVGSRQFIKSVVDR